MDSNSVSPMPDTAPIAEFDKSPPTPPDEPLPMDDLPPPPGGSVHGDDTKETALQPPDESSDRKGDGKSKKIDRAGDLHFVVCQYEENAVWSCCNWCEYVLVVMLAAILLIASITITIFWVMYYRDGFGWSSEPEKQFNLHPVLMVAGFITFSGFSILLYRICRCFRRIYVKLFHTIFHALAIPCIVVGFLAVFEYHNNSNIPNFYSMHSWLGMVTMGLFGIQFVFGFFSFLLLLCCENATVGYRASLVPVHAAFGLITFVLAICTCLTGLTETAFTKLGSGEFLSENPDDTQQAGGGGGGGGGKRGGGGAGSLSNDEYAKGNLEGLVMNVLAMVLVALVILISYTVRSTSDKSDDSTVFQAKMSQVISTGSRASAGPY